MKVPGLCVLGVESSCDETGLAVYHTRRGLLGHTLYVGGGDGHQFDPEVRQAAEDPLQGGLVGDQADEARANYKALCARLSHTFG